MKPRKDRCGNDKKGKISNKKECLEYFWMKTLVWKTVYYHTLIRQTSEIEVKATKPVKFQIKQFI